MRGILWWSGVAIVALVAGFVTHRLLLPSSQGGSDSLLAGNVTEVVVALEDIPLCRTISGTQLEMRSLPSDAVPDGALTSLEEAVGLMSSVDVFAGETLLNQNITTPNEVTRRLALSIPKTKTVVPIPIDSQLIRTGLIRPGDSIDVASTFEIEIQRSSGTGAVPETVALLRNVEVHALIVPVQDIEMNSAQDENDSSEQSRNSGGMFRTSESNGQTIIVALDRDDAVTLQHVIDIGGRLGVLLHVPGNESVAETLPVDALYLAERYNIPLVRGEPFQLTEEYFLDNMEEFVFTGEGIPKPDISDLSN